MNPQAVTLLIRNDLGVCASILVQRRMRSPQDREVDPTQSQRLQTRMDRAPQDVIRQQRRYHLLTRKHPTLVALVWQRCGPRRKPPENLRVDADVTFFTCLGGIDVAPVPRTLHSNRSRLEEIAG